MSWNEDSVCEHPRDLMYRSAGRKVFARQEANQAWIPGKIGAVFAEKFARILIWVVRRRVNY